MVQKLSNFAKFDLDLKITRYHFFYLLEEISTVTPAVNEEENQEEQ